MALNVLSMTTQKNPVHPLIHNLCMKIKPHLQPSFGLSAPCESDGLMNVNRFRSDLPDFQLLNPTAMYAPMIIIHHNIRMYKLYIYCIYI